MKSRCRLSTAPRLGGIFLFAALVLFRIAAPPAVDAAATIVVDTVADEDLQNTSCSLREAIVAANTNADYKGCSATGAGANDLIVFDIDTPTITIGSTSLPAITDAVTIDGGDGRVELHGPGGPRVAGKHGLIINSGGATSVIRNLVVNNFADDGIYVDASNVSIVDVALIVRAVNNALRGCS